MTRDNLSYPWTQPNIDLCHLLPTELPAHRQTRRGEDPSARRCYSMPPCAIAMATFAIILHVLAHASRLVLILLLFRDLRLAYAHVTHWFEGYEPARKLSSLWPFHPN
jgi:hypothetical protein